MTNLTLPWEGMPESSRRRISTITNHNVYWITDLEGRCGIFIKSRSEFANVKTSISLNGIDLIKRNSTGTGELILLLNDIKDAPIFNKICEDLISSIEQHENNDAMIIGVEVRLQRWQELLRKGHSNVMSVELQMGLFSELVFLKDYLSRELNIESAIISWVGPEFDKQDFLFDSAIVEVKSYRTSKGQLVDISSKQQLYSEKQPLFLVTFGLTRSEAGQTVEDIVSEILELLAPVSKLTLDVFNTKLINYGYIPELKNEPYVGFIIDKTRFFSIGEGFPRIPFDIPLEIVKLGYTIDLSLCNAFEVTFDNIFT
ncbi:conserved hypothetical protein [Methylotenera mobilis JLW8]|uniref:PD-(D/E)XK motif protein n=2 Tax=Methylotenera mobilis TaxID=359408 RepID=C6WXV0_METML|nr:conserved hypothetical protein [Methylotenera mobilis JLW8]